MPNYIVSDGSHVIADDEDLEMFHINYSFRVAGTVVVFADSIESVRTLVKRGKDHMDMPLPFKGQNGSQNIEDIIVEVANPTAP